MNLKRSNEKTKRRERKEEERRNEEKTIFVQKKMLRKILNRQIYKQDLKQTKRDAKGDICVSQVHKAKENNVCIKDNRVSRDDFELKK